MKGFRQFLMRGNVIDLAVAVVIGAAFGSVISAFVKDLLTPLIAAIGGQPDFSSLAFTIHGSQFRYGEFVNSLITFIIVAAAVYAIVVVPFSRFHEKPESRQCPECLGDIPLAARRCSHCGQAVIPKPVARTAER